MTKRFFYMGLNSNTKSGVSWKIWWIQRKAFTVTTWWGRAEVRKHRLVAARALQSKARAFDSTEEALAFEQQRISLKLQNGYEPYPRKR